MSDEAQKNKKAKPPREERIKAALRANLQRRKMKARALKKPEQSKPDREN